MRTFETPHATITAVASNSGALPTVRRIWFGGDGRVAVALIGCPNPQFTDQYCQPNWSWGSGTCLIRIDVQAGEITHQRSFPATDNRLPDVPAVSPDLTHIAWNDRKKYLVLSGWSSGSPDRVLCKRSWERCAAIEFSPNGRRIVALHERGGLEVALGVTGWDLLGPIAPCGYSDGISGIAGVNAGIAGVSDEPEAHINGSPIRALAFSPHSDRLCAIRDDGRIVWWEPATLKALPQPWKLPGEGLINRGFLAFTPDGTRLIAAANDVLAVFDEHGKLLRHWSQPNDFHQVAVGPDGARLVTVDGSSTIQIWRTSDGSKLAAMDFGMGQATALAVSPNGQTAVAGFVGGHLLHWDLPE
jgi:WD40 repeat protein